MDLSTTIIGLMLLCLFIIPVILISRSGKSRGKRLLTDLMAQAADYGMRITESDTFNNSVLGLDTESRKVLFIDENGSEKKIFMFSINDIKSFNTVPEIDNRNKIVFNSEKISRMSLRFSFKDISRPDLTVDFFTPGFGRLTETEKNLFYKWSDLLLKNMR